MALWTLNRLCVPKAIAGIISFEYFLNIQQVDKVVHSLVLFISCYSLEVFFVALTFFLVQDTQAENNS